MRRMVKALAVVVVAVALSAGWPSAGPVAGQAAKGTALVTVRNSAVA